MLFPISWFHPSYLSLETLAELFSGVASLICIDSSSIIFIRRFYISLFSYIFPPVQYTMCAIHGFLSAVVWACQGIILGDNATDKDRGTKSGFFLAVYMFGSVSAFILTNDSRRLEISPLDTL